MAWYWNVLLVLGVVYVYGFVLTWVILCRLAAGLEDELVVAEQLLGMKLQLSLTWPVTLTYLVRATWQCRRSRRQGDQG